MNDKPVVNHVRRGRSTPRRLAVAPDPEGDDGPVEAVAADGLLARLADLAAGTAALHHQDVAAVLDATVGLAVCVIRRVESAGILSLGRDGGAVTASVHSDDVARRLDECQATLVEGPGVDSARLAAAPAVSKSAPSDHDAAPVESIDLRMGGGAAVRWPRFAAEAQRLGVHGCLSVPLVSSSPPTGRVTYVLNLYGRDARLLGRTDDVVARALVAHATTAVGAARATSGLCEALRTRDVIGQAKGILMERHGLDADGAFARLVGASQHANLKLREVALWLVEDAALRPPR